MLNLRSAYLLSLALLPLFVTASAAHAQPLVGTVYTSAGEPIGSVTVSTNTSRSTALTDRNGVFRLHLSPGSHAVRFRRIGFEPTQVGVQIDSSSPGDTLRVILNPAPRELKGLVVRAERDDDMSLTLTPQTMRNAPALGETDVFRTLPLLPSISQPNDQLDIIHLAGGASDEAAITLGGHPLQAPFHAGNIFGALNVAALSQANVLMHHLPAGRDGYLSGEIALVPRTVGDQGSREVVVSLLSASATITQPFGARHGFLASARTTYLEHVVKAVSGGSSSDELGIPGFRDLLVKINGGVGDAWTWDAIAYGMHNAAQATNLRPGERPSEMMEGMFGIHGSYNWDRWTTNVRMSVDENRAGNAELYVDSGNVLASRDNSVRQRWISGALDVGFAGDRWQFRSGFSGHVRRHRFLWSKEFVDLAINTPVPSPLDTVTSQQRFGASAEGSVALSANASISVGSHLSLLGGRAYPAPRVLFTWKPNEQIEIDAALNRRFQFDAVAGDPRELSASQPVFFLDRPRRADIAALSFTWNTHGVLWFSRARFGSSVYAKEYRDRTIVEPQSIPTSVSPPPDTRTVVEFERGPGNVQGISLTAELSTENRLTLYGSYTGERVREVYRGQVRPSAWDKPHQVSLYASLALSKRLSINTVFQAHSGPAATPVLYRVLVPGPIGYLQRYMYGKPNSARFPGYRRMDASIGYTWSLGRGDWKLSAQVFNLFMRPNGLRYYLPNYLQCAGFGRACVDQGATQRSLPILPSLGLEVRW